MGCVSDLHLMESYLLLQNLLPGDLVSADCGFNIQESVDFYCCAKVKMIYLTCKVMLTLLHFCNAKCTLVMHSVYCYALRIYAYSLPGYIQHNYCMRYVFFSP